MTIEQQRIAVASIIGNNDKDYPIDANTRKEMLEKLTLAQKIRLIESVIGYDVSDRWIDWLQILELDQPTFCRHWLKVVGRWSEKEGKQ